MGIIMRRRRHRWLGRIVILAVLLIAGMIMLTPGNRTEHRTGNDASIWKEENAPGNAAQNMPGSATDSMTGDEVAGEGSYVTDALTTSARNEDEDRKGEETIVGWMIDRIAAGEVELSEENSIRQSLDEAERELGITLTEENKDKVVAFLQTLGNIGVETGDFIDQAKEKYQEYSAEIVEEANEVINEAVESAVTNAAQNFWDSIRQAAGDFFSSLMPE